ncbi:hypothetical protein CARUB_v10025279mg [Capsella rubella]|uniref:Knottin scorpion toxin-like domain-containing protein n=1 Tax=Capsella rubella TaxID=81985 RepID=R0HUG3_9BRAS|nr:putative defensin-like protein 137 [Capsella rubella]EOA29025.1 hypothetical protein CARUB_v10025279mg [Capsella rubella]
MKRNFQPSFVILVIFIVLMIGAVGSMSFEIKLCWAPLKLKDNNCDYNECRSMCLKKNPKGHGRCIKSFQERIICLCGYPCP